MIVIVTPQGDGQPSAVHTQRGVYLGSADTIDIDHGVFCPNGTIEGEIARSWGFAINEAVDVHPEDVGIRLHHRTRKTPLHGFVTYDATSRSWAMRRGDRLVEADRVLITLGEVSFGGTFKKLENSR